MVRSRGDQPEGSGAPDGRLAVLVRQALELSGDERAAFLAETCGGDTELRAELEARLTRAEVEGGSLAALDESLPTDQVLPHDSPIGRQIKQYRVEKRLGGGAMGIVYSAWDTRLDRRVALKFLPEHMSVDPESKKRFLVEARAAARIDHPNICHVHEIGETEDGYLFIAMGFYEGETLKKALSRGPLSLDDSVSYAVQIASGLAAAHAGEIVHRDIKPANILVTQEGVAKVLDFGIAKMQDQLTLTPRGGSFGTVAYMSPEQLRGEELDHRADIWSLGILLCEMITGRGPFRSERIAAIMHAISSPTPVELPAELPAKMKGFLKKALSKDPARRPDTMEAFAGDLLAATGRTGTGHPAIPGPVAARPRRVSWTGRAAISAVALVSAVLLFRAFSADPTAASDSAIAVFPFENLSSDEDQDFTDGIHYELIARLAEISGLRVISRASIISYRGSAMTAGEIAQQLGVSLLLEGSVQRVADQVKITALLTDTRADATLWSASFQEEQSDLFEIQREVGEQIASRLNVTLSPREIERVGAELNTDSDEAYGLYLQGRAYEQSRTEPELLTALGTYQQAIQADSNFALAYVSAGLVNLRLYWFNYDQTPERLARSKAAIDRAFVLEPDLPEAHLVRAWYLYQGERDYDAALAELDIARRGLAGAPGELSRLRGAVERRRGNFEEAARHQIEAFELSPRDAGLALDIANTFTAMRRYHEAEPYFDLAIEIGPPSGAKYWWKAWNYALQDGNTERARPVLVEADRVDPTDWRDRTLHWVRIEFLSGDPAAALDRALLEPNDWITTQYGDIPTNLLIGEAYYRLDDLERSREYYEAARDLLELRRDTYPDDAFVHRNLSFAYAGLGDEQEALSMGIQARNLLSLSHDALVAPDFLRDLAAVYMQVGEAEIAINYLESLLSMSGRSISVPLLRSSPVWDPLRENPRFAELVADN